MSDPRVLIALDYDQPAAALALVALLLFVVMWFNFQACSRNDAHTGGQRGRSVTPMEKGRLFLPKQRM